MCIPFKVHLSTLNIKILAMKKLIYAFVLLICVACGSDHDPEVDYLTLSSRHISTESEGTSRVITVNSTSDWTIVESSVPSWCTIDEQTEDGFKITILPNHTFNDREVEILTKNTTTSNSIDISQCGIKNKTSLEWHTFPVNSFSEVNYDDATNEYTVGSREMFITSSIRNQIFHGDIIKESYVQGEDLQQEGNYTFNPITISAFVGGNLYSRESVIPSKEVTNSLFNDVVSDYPTQSVQFVASSPIQFNSYKHLHLLGVGNLGLKLDEITTGKSYVEHEMGNRTGLIYTYSSVLFHTIMDLVPNLIQQGIPEGEVDHLAYISTIGYGKTACLIVETDYDYNFSKLVVNKLMHNEELNEEEKKVLDGLTATYLFFQEDGTLSVSNGYQAISAYTTGFDAQPIVPLTFVASDLQDNSLATLKFTFEMP